MFLGYGDRNGGLRAVLERRQRRLYADQAARRALLIFGMISS